MKKLIMLLAIGLTLPAAWAENMGTDFHKHYVPGTSNLKAYTRDLNTLVGTVDFQTGQPTMFPGIHLGASVSAFKPSDRNDISSDNYTVLPFLIAQTKIPYVDVGVVMRTTAANGYRSVGGGLTYDLTLIEFLQLSLGAFYDNGRTDWYRNDHYSATAIVSADVLFFTPFFGVGYDYGKLKTRDYAHNSSASDATVRGMVGLNISPLPLLTGFIAYSATKDSHGFSGGLGLKF